ncbi:PucR family transcriptional regulator [Virgibacillus ihumii]|uniref:PucR family transcriptional regulator n=1 Tax=Virgibacillus ihumii TaxID=2686091 RepID=UPI00157DD5AD|nr:helix-turn-helix domain-containing protein [Virgibacillus ihumii]
MINKLRKIFISLIFFEDLTTENTEHYHWFRTKDNDLIGIAKDELSQKDVTLLSAFLQPYHIAIPEMTSEEKKWNRLLHGYKPETADIAPYRIIYFSFSKFQLEPAAFKEAIQAFFAKQVPIIWRNEHEGIIIETNPDADLSFDQIINILMSDLYVKIKFLIGPCHDSLKDVRKNYAMLVQGADSAFPHSEKAVIPYTEAVHYILLNQADSKFLGNAEVLILGEFRHDEELLKTIEMFITCNLNISVTAKKLHLHRNSLQYRLDKFIEKTGIDIRQFQQAMTVYLAILYSKN